MVRSAALLLDISAAALVAVLLAVNVGLGVWLPSQLARSGDRLQVEYAGAWMVWPGTVHVRGLQIVGQGRRDQWMVRLGSARADIDLPALRNRELRVTRLRARDGAFRYRLWEPVLPPSTPLYAPPIPGLEDPPPIVDTDVARRPWKIVLEGAVVDDVREIWIDQRRYLGRATVRGDLVLDEQVSLDAIADVHGVRALIRERPMASTAEGVVSVRLDQIERFAPLDASVLPRLDVEADVRAEAHDLGFLEGILRDAPWLRVEGSAEVVVAVAVDSGVIRPGSIVRAETRDLAVRIRSMLVEGDGTVQFEAERDTDRGRMTIDFGDFVIHEEGQQPLVQGQGFSVAATTESVVLGATFPAVSVAITLPESQVTNLRLLDRLLPDDVGFVVRGGEGRVGGHLEWEGTDKKAIGAMSFAGRGLVASYDELTLTSNVDVELLLADGDLDSGVYDISGSEVSLVGLSVSGPEIDGPTDWWARVGAVQGRVRTGDDPYFVADLALRSASSRPFVQLIAQERHLAGWVQGLLDVPDVSGTGRLVLGLDTMNVQSLAVEGGNAELKLRLRKRGKQSRGQLFARMGPLSIGFGFSGEDHELHLLGARRWFEGAGDQP